MVTAERNTSHAAGEGKKIALYRGDEVRLSPSFWLWGVLAWPCVRGACYVVTDYI